MKYYDIFLTAFQEPNENTDGARESAMSRDAVIMKLRELAPENADFLDAGVLPVLIARHATTAEKEFYKEFAVNNACVIEAKQLKQSSFERFDEEVVLLQQDEDAHILEKTELLSKIRTGVSELKEKDALQRLFETRSADIQSLIIEREEVKRTKFFPYGALASFGVWAMMAVLIFLLRGIHADVVFMLSMAFVVVMTASVVYDYVAFKKKFKQHFSPAGEKAFWQKLLLLNREKTQAILAVEAKIDRLEARRCITVVRAERRNLADLEEIANNGDEMPLSKIHDIICGE